MKMKNCILLANLNNGSKSIVGVTRQNYCRYTFWAKNIIDMKIDRLNYRGYIT